MMADFVAEVLKVYPKMKLPKKELGSSQLNFFAMMMKPLKALKIQYKKLITYDNSLSVKELGMEYKDALTGLPECLKTAMTQSLVAAAK